jgi:hypothetical protein
MKLHASLIRRAAARHRPAGRRRSGELDPGNLLWSGRCVAAARPGHGLFGLDRDRRRQPLHRPQPDYFLIRHASSWHRGRAAVVAFQVPMRAWQACAVAVPGGVVLLLVLIPGIGRDVNGARRWLPLGPVNLQPSELMKLFAVLYAADYTVRKLPRDGLASSRPSCRWPA